MRKKYLCFVCSILASIFVAGNSSAYASGKTATKTKKSLEVKDAKEIVLNNKSTAKNVVREIEVDSVNFIKLKNKAAEVFIPNPNVIDIQLLSDNSLYLMGIAPGITSLVINDKDGNVMVNCKVKVTYPIKAIKDAIAEMRPDADVELLSIDKSVILKGRAPSPEAASDIQDIVAKFVDEANIINKLAIETSTQVMLKVKIAEVSRDITKSLGLNWRAMSLASGVNGMSYGLLSGNASYFPENVTTETADSIAKTLSTNFTGDDGPLKASLTGGRWLVHSGGSNGVAGIIDALANENFASILAEPTIMAISGKTATFKSGGEYGYTVTQEGTNSKTTEFKEWGTSVEFTPVVMSEDRISITVTPKVSTLTTTLADSSAPPALTNKEATTTVELGSGQSLAIAGLLQRNNTTSSSEVPLLASIPLLGALFRSSNVKIDEKEVVIIITPYIVKPSSKELKTPVEMVPRMYSPIESIIHRKFNKGVRKRLCAGFSLR